MDHIPETLGRYEILEELGRGAMGVVYLALDPVIGRQVALKVLQLPPAVDEGDQEQFRSRFIREAQSAGILSHPNIVTIHDVSDGEGDRPTFIAMEHVQGTNLKDLMRTSAPLDLPFIQEVVSQVAAGLDYAHGKGVVHRDVKPANILLTDDGDVKITDFGIARLESSNLTQDTQRLGTPNYMAPEQVLGEEADHRVDIFSLGVLIYEMVTGSKPFRGETVTEVTHRIVYEEPVDLDREAPGLPRQLKGVVERALAKDPQDRYGRAGDLAEDLRELVERATAVESLNATQMVEVPPPPPAGGPATQKGARSAGLPWMRWAVLAGLTLVVGLGAGVGLLAWLEPEDVEIGRSAEQELHRRHLELVREGRRLLAGGDAQGAAEAFRRAERLAPQQLGTASWRQLAESQAEALEEAQQRQRQLGEHLALARLALSDGRYETARDEARTALELIAEASGGPEPGAADRDGLDSGEAAVADGEPVRPAGDAAPAAVAEPMMSAADREAAARARALLDEAEAGLERRHRAAERRRVAERRAQQADAAAADEAADTAEEVARQPVPPPPAAPPSGPPRLEVVFISEQPQGHLAVFVGEERLLNRPFRFVERKGPLGLGGSETYKGRLYLPPTEVATGDTTLRVYVTPKGQAAQVEILEGVRFAEGQQRTLDILFTGGGQLRVDLQ